MIDLAALEALEKAMSPAPWEVDSEDTDGCYGSGEDTYEGYKAFAIFSGDKRICGTENSSDGEVHEEFDEEGCYAWDDVAKNNMDGVAATRNALPTLISRVRELEARVKLAEDLMIGIQEYWNGSRTDGAMLNALETIEDRARAFLEAKHE